MRQVIATNDGTNKKHVFRKVEHFILGAEHNTVVHKQGSRGSAAERKLYAQLINISDKPARTIHASNKLCKMMEPDAQNKCATKPIKQTKKRRWNHTLFLLANLI